MNRVIRAAYDDLLATFWSTHDPTIPNRQGFDVGSQRNLFTGNDPYYHWRTVTHVVQTGTVTAGTGTTGFTPGAGALGGGGGAFPGGGALRGAGGG